MRQAIGTGGAVEPTASPPHVPHAEESEAVARLAALARGWRWLVGGVALAFSCYQLVVAAFHPWSSQLIREWHVAFLLALTFLLYPARRLAAAAAPPVRGGGIGGLLLALGAASLALYYGVFEHDLILRAGDPTQADLVVGVALLILVFEAARRVLGWPLPLLCALFLLYALFGQWAPGALAHRGYAWQQVVEQLSFGAEGIFGIPIYVSATYIFLFILFGAFLERAGMVQLFNDVALGLVGRAAGGPAKVSVLSSALMGTISGSAVANVLTTGQFTIPLMKRGGFSPTFAAAVEATASMGGQVMPPVMGAVAFIMAENIGVPYAEIVRAAIVPALLYFATVFWMVHLEAKRRGLEGLAPEDCPNAWQALRSRWYLVLPLAGLVWLLFAGYTPMYAGMAGLALTAVLVLGTAVAAMLSRQAFRYLFWIAVGVWGALVVRWGVLPVLLLLAALGVVLLWRREGRNTLHLVRESLVVGAMQALPVGVACAIVGVIIGVLTLTGAATSLAGYILSVGEQHLLLALVLTMLICLVLGMGIPTIPNYIIVSAIAAPALLELGVPLIVSHMYVFYFGLMADLTPPVALAAYAASSVAKSPPLPTSLKAFQLGIAGFVVPYLAVYDPALMLQGDPAWWAVLWAILRALFAIGCWGYAIVGARKGGSLAWWERLWAVAAAILLATPWWVADLAGIFAAGLLIVRLYRFRSEEPTRDDSALRASAGTAEKRMEPPTGQNG
ncbi:MAG: TRAP transporter permease [Hydrogenophilus thermoluteolus]